jgi:hypothetical protein
VNLFRSTTGQLIILVLGVAAIPAANGQLEWADWLSSAVVLVGMYVGKESAKRGAAAYRDKGAPPRS